MTKFFRKVIRISAMDSPNVKLALEQQRRGMEPTGDAILPGVLTWEQYQHRRLTWDAVRQCVGLDGEFYEGAELLLFPPEWLNKAEEAARQYGDNIPVEAIGVDTAEGGDNTTWACAGKRGLRRLVSLKTPDTAVITGRTIALRNEFRVEDDAIMFDQGGGGQEHADRLRYQGYQVRDVSFGESVAPEPVRFMKPWEEKQHERRERFVYRNRRAQMYWLLHLRLNPGTEATPYPYNNGVPYAIPAEYQELRRQLSVMPLLYDEEGRIEMLPKSRRYGSVNSNRKTLKEILGCSPDEADALVLANYALEEDISPMTISPIF